MLTLWRNRVLQYAGVRVTCDLRIALFRHLQSLSLRYFDANQTGKVISRITQDTGELYSLTNNFLINLIADSVTVVGVLGFLYWMEWRLALAVTLVLPLFVINYLYNRRKMKKGARVYRDNRDQVVGFVQERVAAARVVKSFTLEAAEGNAFAVGIRVLLENGVDKGGGVSPVHPSSFWFPSSMVEQLTLNQLVPGSIPGGTTTFRHSARLSSFVRV